MNKTVAIVGRPNVGKSTLFNRFIKTRKAIVHESEGVTRDRTYAKVEWSGETFDIIDTGGIMTDPKNSIDESIRDQAFMAADESDLILFVLDVRTGITHYDEAIAKLLKHQKKPVLVIVNKVDDLRFEQEINDFYSLGFGMPYGISALGGRAIGDLLDVILENLPDKIERPEKESDLKIALLGMPNAGKSTIANIFLGEERHIVTDIPGTTRDSINSTFNYQNKKVMLLDTAGLRKKARVKDPIEYYSSVRTHRAIRESDICLLIIDINKGFGTQDIRIIQDIHEQRKGLILCMNKWDLIEKEFDTAQIMTKDLLIDYPMLAKYPLFYISGLEKQRLFKVLDEAFSVKERMKKRISTSELNTFFEKIIKRTPPPSVKGRYIRIKYVTQVLENPPLIAFFCNEPGLIPDNYKKYLENKLRDHYDFKGVPIKILFKSK